MEINVVENSEKNSRPCMLPSWKGRKRTEKDKENKRIAAKKKSYYCRFKTCKHCGRTTNLMNYIKRCGKQGRKCAFRLKKEAEKRTWSYKSPLYCE